MVRPSLAGSELGGGGERSARFEKPPGRGNISPVTAGPALAANGFFRVCKKKKRQ